MGLVAGDEKFQQRVRQLLEGKGKEVGREARKKLEPKPLPQLEKILEMEKDFRIWIWIRVKLLGESQVALAGEFGYKSNVSIHQIAKRVEEKAKENPALKAKIEKIRKMLIVND